MTNKDKSLRDWAEQGEQLLPQTWEQMPDIYLYMDQVITCLQGMLKFYDIDEKNPLITNSMINNYVKNGVVERPVKKKYSRSHLARLYMICLLKQVLSMQEIDRLLREYPDDPQVLFEKFAGMISEVTRPTCARVTQAGHAGEQELRELALRLSVEAAAKQTAAKKIIESLDQQQTENKNDPSN